MKIKEFLSEFNPVGVEVLPYHTLGVGKYEKLGIECMNFEIPSEETVSYYKKLLEQ